MLMIAIRDVASTVSMIPAGSQFHELDPDRAQDLIAKGDAKPAVASVVAAVPEVKGWRGLDWKDSTVVIIGGGESATDERIEAVHKWRMDPPNRRVIAINTSYAKAPWADILYACDGRWWTTYFKGTTHFSEAAKTFAPNQMWTQDKDTAQKLGIKFIESAKLFGLNKNPNKINQGQSGGYQAINIAYHAGAKKIVLLGFDAKGGHHHGDHPPGIAARSPFKAWIENFRGLAADLKAEGVEVVNCSEGTAIDAFPVRPLEEVCPSQSATSVPSQPLGAMRTSTDSGGLGTGYSTPESRSRAKTS